ncbi:MAG TPA: hypothetical protein VFS19_01510 [Planctomycetota bacterium]|nr:hypothetical protein [Planctomycetota bacterium]
MKLTRIITYKGKHDMIRKKFDVTSSPTIFFLSSDGKKVDEGRTSAEGLAKEINEVIEKYNRTPKWAADEETAVAAAQEEQKPLVVVYKDDKAKSEQAIPEFNVLPLADLYEKAVWLQRKIDVKSDEAKALGITAVPVMWIIDIRVADPQARVLKKVPLPKPGAGIKADLAGVLKTWKGTGKTEEPKKE